MLDLSFADPDNAAFPVPIGIAGGVNFPPIFPCSFLISDTNRI